MKILLSSLILTLFVFLFLFPGSVQATNLVWKLTYPSPDESTEIRISDSDNNIAFASIRKPAGVFDLLKSVDAGKTWVSIKSNLVSGSDVNWISIGHTNPNLVALSIWGSGIYLSNNGGLGTNAWAQIQNLPFARTVGMDPKQINIMYSGITDTDSGIYVTNNSGTSWDHVGTGNSVVIVTDPKNDGRVFSNLGGTFVRSLDYGKNWTPLTLPCCVSSAIIDVQASNVLYASLSTGLEKSENNGDLWTHLNVAGGYPFTFRVAQDSIGYLYTSIRGSPGSIWRSKDRGSTWEDIGDPLWGQNNTWGMDVKNGRIIASVHGGDVPGIYIANTDGTAIDGGPTHTECRSNACAIVEGEGTNSCTTNSDCAQQVFCDNMQTWSTTGDAPLTSTLFLTGHTINGGNLVGARYDFGDWQNDYYQPWLGSVNHTYDNPGTYTVRGYVRDNLGNEAGGTGNCQTQVIVKQPQNPVVVIPGFGGSWSTKAIVLHNQDASYRDWIMMPFKAPEIYNPFLQALETAGYAKNQKSFYFAYDFTKSITETASWLNDFLTDQVVPQNPGKKIDIVAHSMGGLIARTCFEQVSGCKDKINKIVTAGTPHQGAVDSYYFWEGADILGLDRLSKFGAKLLLHIDGAPKWKETDIIHSKFIGVKDLLPFNEYIFNKPYAQLQIAQNPNLQTLGLSDAFKSKTMTLSGNRSDSTSLLLTVAPANKKETASGFWLDGKPSILSRGAGDGTVLKSSSEITGALNKSYDVDHVGYFNNSLPVTEIFYYLNLPTTTLTPTKGHKSTTLFYSQSPDLSIYLDDLTATKLSSNVVFSFDTKPNDRMITVTATKDGNYTINGWYYDDLGNEKSASEAIDLTAGQKTEVKLKFN